MIFINFNIDVLRAQLKAGLSQTVSYLQQAPKTFVVEVDAIQYTVEYEIQGDTVQFFAEAPESLPNLSRPIIKFNIGEFLLPEAMGTDGRIVHPSDFVAAPQVITHDTNPEISPEISKKIMEFIEKEGFFNLIHKN